MRVLPVASMLCVSVWCGDAHGACQGHVLLCGEGHVYHMPHSGRCAAAAAAGMWRFLVVRQERAAAAGWGGCVVVQRVASCRCVVEW